MNPRALFRPFPLAVLVLALALAARAAEPADTLKEVFKDHFPIGTAVNRSMMMGGAGFGREAGQNARDVALLKKHFNQITVENDMKWQLIHPREATDGYDFAHADALVNFGLGNHMQIVGHTSPSPGSPTAPQP